MVAIDFTCGLDAALAVIGGKWKPLILFHLAHGTRRYGELRRAVGSVSDKMLIQQLKELQADGIIDRLDFKEIPQKSNIPSRIRPNVSQSIGPALCLGNQAYEGSRDAHVSSADFGKLRCRRTVLSRGLRIEIRLSPTRKSPLPPEIATRRQLGDERRRTGTHFAQ